MLKNSPVFASFSVGDIDEAKKFYEGKLGLEVTKESMGLKVVANGIEIFVYEKDDHKPATFTILNFVVSDIDKTVKDLKAKGVKFESYDEGMMKTDKDNIARGKEAGMGPDIAWFKDPAGNFFSVLES